MFSLILCANREKDETRETLTRLKEKKKKL